MEINPYYSVGSTDDIVVSNSYSSYINPEQGGSPQKFLNAYKENSEKKETTALVGGKLIHLYAEKPQDFTVAEFDAPTVMMEDLLTRTVQYAVDYQNGFGERGITTDIFSKIKNPEKAATEVKQVEALFDKLATLLNTNRDNAIMALRKARVELGSYKSSGEATLLPNIVEKEVEFIKFLFSAKGKHVLKAEDKEKITGAIQSLTLHPVVGPLLGLQPDDFSDAVVFKELPIYWEYLVSPVSNPEEGEKVMLKFKALLDRLVIDFGAKTIHLIDLKSTSSSLYLFQESFEKYRYYRQMAFYLWAIGFWFAKNYPNLNIQAFKVSVTLVPVETNGLFLTAPYSVSQAWLFKGRTEFQSLVKRIAYHQLVNNYEASYEEIVNNGYLHFGPPPSLVI